MRELTKATEIISCPPSPVAATLTQIPEQPHPTSSSWSPHIGQVFLGNSNDVPSQLIHSGHSSKSLTAANFNADPALDIEDDPFDYHSTNDPSRGLGYDLCVRCLDTSRFPSSSELRAVETHLDELERAWIDRCRAESPTLSSSVSTKVQVAPRPRPPPHASSMLHLDFPCTFSSQGAPWSNLISFSKFLEKLLVVGGGDHAHSAAVTNAAPASAGSGVDSATTPSSRRWSLISAIPSLSSPSHGSRSRSGSTKFSGSKTQSKVLPSRPLKILIYSSDGYTESSVLALSLLMVVRRLTLPEAYLELQVVKRRSFFVYSGDLMVLKMVEEKLQNERERNVAPGVSGNGSGTKGAGAGAAAWLRGGSGAAPATNDGGGSSRQYYANTTRSSVTFMSIPISSSSAPTSYTEARSRSSSMVSTADLANPPVIVPSQGHLVKNRPRASTSPWLPSLFNDHEAWFNDLRFDGSFPSRVLPFLYLGDM
jgi:dual specificity MAP kinase phosphatase